MVLCYLPAFRTRTLWHVSDRLRLHKRTVWKQWLRPVRWVVFVFCGQWLPLRWISDLLKIGIVLYAFTLDFYLSDIAVSKLADRTESVLIDEIPSFVSVFFCWTASANMAKWFYVLAFLSMLLQTTCWIYLTKQTYETGTSVLHVATATERWGSVVGVCVACSTAIEKKTFWKALSMIVSITLYHRKHLVFRISLRGNTGIIKKSYKAVSYQDWDTLDLFT